MPTEIKDEIALLSKEFEQKCSTAKTRYSDAFDYHKTQVELKKIEQELACIDKNKYSEPEERQRRAQALKKRLGQLKTAIDNDTLLAKPVLGMTVSQSRGQLMNTLMLLNSRCDDHICAMISSDRKPSPLSDPKETKKVSKGFNLFAQLYKQKISYAKLRKGKKYTIAGIQKPSTEPLSDRNPVRDISAKNLRALKLKLKASGDEKGFGLKSDEVELFATLLNLPYQLQHATDRFYEIAQSGSLDSLAELRRRHPSTTSFFSTKGNIEALGNDGFVFFRIYVEGFNGDSTRYGNTRIVADMTLLRSCGWVSLHDQLYLFSTTNGKRVYEGKRLLTMSQPVLINGTCQSKKALYDGLEYTYRRSPVGDVHKGKKDTQASFGTTIKVTKEKISFTDEIFYGRDILPGIALSAIARLRNLNKCGYRDQFLETFKFATTSDERIRLAVSLLMKFFRIEAKYPSRLELRFQDDEYHIVTVNDGQRAIYVDNPDGDHRYSKDLAINDEDYKDTLIADELTKLETDLSSARRLAARNSSEANKVKKDALEKRQEALKALQTQRKKRKEDAIEAVFDACDEYDVHSISTNLLLLIHDYFLFLLEETQVTLAELIDIPYEKLSFLSDTFFLELMENSDATLCQLNSLTIEELTFLKDFDLSIAIHEREIHFDEIIECIQNNQQRLYYLCCEDLDDALLDVAPKVQKY